MSTCLLITKPVCSDDGPVADAAGRPGHSQHGEAFNEGPRQAAYLMTGTGQVSFPVSTSVPLAQQFMDQGVGQLHGFWYFEAERSFRQVAALDPKCAMAYWGMAMANVNNRPRARKFLEKADSLKSSLNAREQLYLTTWNDYFAATLDDKKADRGKRAVQGMEKIVKQFPDDLEAKAFLACQIWKNSGDGVEITSHVAVDALLQQIVSRNPLHPCHHYRIHLWDKEDPAQALTSAALCGAAAPAIAHMWHMPGHTYSELHRYADAVWQQEASARIDHAYMMRDGLLPDQIHNYAHNNQWLVQNWIKLGRGHDALSLALNMSELPRHPKFNTLAKGGSSATYGRQRTLDVLQACEWWDELIRLSDSAYLDPGTNPSRMIDNHLQIGRAAYLSDQAHLAERELDKLRAWLAQSASHSGDTAPGAESSASTPDAKTEEGADEESEKDVSPPAASRVTSTQLPWLKPKQRQRLEQAIRELEAWQLWSWGKADEAWRAMSNLPHIPYPLRARVMAAAGKTKEADALWEKSVRDLPGELLPRLHLAAWRWEQGRTESAQKVLLEAREWAEQADLDLPAMVRVAPIAASLGWPDDWRVPATPRTDFGERPDLASLGPVRWQPGASPDWEAVDAAGNAHQGSAGLGRNRVVILYLGFGCLHCVEQLQAFAPRTAAFREAGWEIVAIGTDDREKLAASIANYDQSKIPFPLLADPELKAFRAFRCFDDFEQKPLHGTFLVDQHGLLRWMDIGHEPFVDHEFLLGEAQRINHARLRASTNASPAVVAQP